MKNQVLNPSVIRLTLTSCLVATSAIVGNLAETIALPSAPAVAAPIEMQPARLQTKQGIQPLTCVQDTQGLMCSTDAQAALPLEKSNSDSVAASTLNRSQQHRSQQLGQISDTLIGFLYFVCPVGLGLAVFLHDKNDAERTRILNTQIETLERIWKQNPNRFEH